MALLGLGEMSDLSPQGGPHRTLVRPPHLTPCLADRDLAR
jgi:hypothetical protein